MSNLPPGQSEKWSDRASQSVIIKIIVIGLMIGLLMIPSFIIYDLVNERAARYRQVVAEISTNWGQPQQLTGPIINIPYKTWQTNADGQRIMQIAYAHFLPEELSVDANLHPELRKRSIYQAVLYKSDLNMEGFFNYPNFTDLGVDAKDILWDQAFVTLGISDMRGINENITLNWNGQNLLFEPGTGNNDICDTGVHCNINLNINNEIAANSAGNTNNHKLNFKLNLDLNGSDYLHITPLGKETSVAMASPWNDPSYNGAFLPDTKDSLKSGFKAHWKVLHLNRNYPQEWLGTTYSVQNSSFGVSLMQTVSHYDKTNRSTKYALLFLVLTFTSFFFTEILNRLRIHPIQYLMVGFAICIFYLLLLSLAEYISFNLAYIVAASGVVGLITLYCNSIFNNKWLTLGIFSVLVLLYGFLFTLLQLEDYALLIGSLGLFAFLATVMHLSRKIDWYQLGSK